MALDQNLNEISLVFIFSLTCSDWKHMLQYVRKPFVKR